MPKHHIHHAIHHNLTTFSPPQKPLKSQKPNKIHPFTAQDLISYPNFHTYPI